MSGRQCLLLDAWNKSHTFDSSLCSSVQIMNSIPCWVRFCDAPQLATHGPGKIPEIELANSLHQVISDRPPTAPRWFRTVSLLRPVPPSSTLPTRPGVHAGKSAFAPTPSIHALCAVNQLGVVFLHQRRVFFVLTAYMILMDLQASISPQTDVRMSHHDENVTLVWLRKAAYQLKVCLMTSSAVVSCPRGAARALVITLAEVLLCVINNRSTTA